MRRLSAGFCSGAIIAVMVGSLMPANAQTTRKARSIDPPEVQASTADRPTLFGSATVFSDNRGQGFSSNSGDPAVQLDAGVIWNRFYFGLSGSNVDLGTDPATSRSVGHTAVSYYAGYVGSIRKVDWDVSASYATYPGAKDAGSELDYWEFSAGASTSFFRDFRSGLRVYWSPEYTANQGQNWVIETSTQKPLGKYHGISPTLEFVSGYQFGDDSKGNFDYKYWEVGLEIAFNKHFSIDLRYHDTFDVPIDCNRLCDGRFVVSATVEF